MMAGVDYAVRGINERKAKGMRFNVYGNKVET